MSTPATVGSACIAMRAVVEASPPPAPGDCEEVARAIAVLQLWYSQNCGGV